MTETAKTDYSITLQQTPKELRGFIQNELKSMNRKEHALTVDIEAINPLQFLAIGITLTEHPGNHLITKAKFVFPTRFWEGQSAESFWKDTKNKALCDQIKELNFEDQEWIKKHAGFTWDKLQFWIKNLETLKKLTLLQKPTYHQLSLFEHEKVKNDIYQAVYTHIREAQKYPNLCYLTDNPPYDIGVLDCLLMQKKFESIREIRISKDKSQYIHCKCVYSLIEGFLHTTYQSKRKMLTAFFRKLEKKPIWRPETHDPVDDCFYMSALYDAFLSAGTTSTGNTSSTSFISVSVQNHSDPYQIQVPLVSKKRQQRLSANTQPLTQTPQNGFFYPHTHPVFTYHGGCLYSL